MDKKLSPSEANALLRKYEGLQRSRYNEGSKHPSREDYLKQTDRNYKDGDRN